MAALSLCIHGHFYQPPREDPITGRIPDEHGAHPYHNWNERIHAECYRPNAELGNFERISFNVGPTLFEWMKSYDPTVHDLIVTQDRANLHRYGVGNAIAQAYNHTILPLSSRTDIITQIYWGIADFEHRFGRKPQGMWLPETAVDLETLSILADQGIEFTILAPWQAESEDLDLTEAYRVDLPQGSSISVFFYNSELSSCVSFNPSATSNADFFSQKELLTRYLPEKVRSNTPQLLLIASDGELYGHHQQFRDRFLAHLVNGASTKMGISPTYLSLWLKNHPPEKSVCIRENTSWSCHHGVLRWVGGCPCTPGDGKWKIHLRQAFDRLAFALDRLYVDVVKPYIPKPWTLRDQYIHVILGEVRFQDLVNSLAGTSLPEDVSLRIRYLLEAQRERQRMYTSCGWFFEDFSRIEPINNVAYAAQAVRLIRIATGVDLSSQIMDDMKHVTSARGGHRGDIVFQNQLNRAEELTRPLLR